MRTIVFGWVGESFGNPSYGRCQAAVWRNNGTSKDLRLARKYAVEMRYRVFVFRTNDPRDVLDLVRKTMSKGPVRC